MRQSLFNLLQPEKVKEESLFASETQTANFFSSGKSRAELVKAIGCIEEGKSYFTFGKGNWSSHELLAFILQQTGAADVWITTWSITEEPIKLLVKMKQQGMIRTLRCLFGDRVPVMSPNAWQVARFNFDELKLSKCHAKVQVIRNVDWGVVIMGSANFTINPRWEAGVVCCDKGIADKYARAIDEALKQTENAE